MNAIKIALEGAPALSRALKLADPATKTLVAATIKQHTQRLRDEARADAPKVSGDMASTIRDEYSADGLTGYVKVGIGKLKRRGQAAKIRRQGGRVRTGKGAYAPVVNYGDPRRHRQAEPFLTRPYQADRPQIIADLDHDLSRVVKDIASP